MQRRAFQDGPALPHQEPGIDAPLFYPPRTVANIRLATIRDLSYVSSIQKAFSNQVGFLPTAALTWLLENQRINLSLENGEPCGYVCGRERFAAFPGLRPITQAAVQYDAQRRHHGLALLDLVTAQAKALGQIGLQACCREGLESNEFWRLAGFKAICILTPENRRNKEVICWRKPLTSKIPIWFAMPPRRAGYRAYLTNSTRNPRKDYNALSHSVRPLDATERSAQTSPTAQENS